MIRRGTGWVPNDPDARDYLVDGSTVLGADTLPDEADCEDVLPDVLDQGTDRSCVAQTFAQLVYAAHARDGHASDLMSRKALWWLCRHQDGLHKSNAGTKLRVAARLTNDLGFCRETYWPHERDFYLRPAIEAQRMMIDQRNLGKGRVRYERIDGDGLARLATIKACIAKDIPVGFGIYVPDDFGAVTDKVVPTPVGADAGHAMVVCGYRPGAFKIRNSWGRNFGVDGNCWITAAYMKTARDLTIVPAAPPFSDEVAS